MPIILGIDPGSQITGYGVIEVQDKKLRYLSSGCIRIGRLSVNQRLQEIYTNIQTIVSQYIPDEVAVEQVFMHRNVHAAIMLGQARGAAIVAATKANVPLAEYSARQIKQSVVGYGAAAKTQVQHMVKHLLGLMGTVQSDAADALAVAICHAHQRENILLGLN